MKIREMSDIHLEFGSLTVPVLENEKEITLILSGDVGVAEKPSTIAPFVEEMASRHKRVLMILGNHEHYHGSMQRSLLKIIKALDKDAYHANIDILENETIVDEDHNVALIGATMWTNCHNADPITVWTIENGLNDFRLIRSGPASHPYMRKLSAMETFAIHRKSTDYIFAEIVKHKAEGRKVVVFTHHAPSTLSIAAEYKKDHHLNGAYASALEERILDTKPDVWFHGHTHHSFDYMLGDTRVICNPRGYAPHDLNPTFDVNLILEV